MKLNWLTSVAVALTIALGTMFNSANAENKGGMHFSQGNAGRSLQSSGGNNNISRSISSSNGLGITSQGMKTQIKTVNGLGSHVQLADRTHTPIIGSVKGINGAILNKPNLNSDAVKGINKAILGNQSLLNSDAAKKIGDAFKKPQLPFNPDLNKKIIPAILNGKYCQPGCGPFKPGCSPWWCHPIWGSCCNYYPCYPHYCPQPIVIPLYVPVVTTVGVVEEQILQIPVGSTVTLEALGLGDLSGQVVAQMDKIAFPAKVNEWKNDSVNATLPLVGLSAPIRGEILLVKADGSLARSVKVEFLPAPEPTDSTSTQVTTTTVVQ